MEIIGVNEPGQAINAFMFLGKPTSWLRDDFTVNVKAAWGVNYRDTFILNPLNGKIEVYNLTDHDLQLPANKAALKAKLIAAATPADTDNDKLPDYWEEWAFGGLGRSPATIGSDGYKTLLHFACCSAAPATGVIRGLPGITTIPQSGGNFFVLRWTQRQGTAFGLTFAPEFSNNLAAWSSAGSGYADWSSRPLYDGSGGEVIEWRSTVTTPERFARVRVSQP